MSRFTPGFTEKTATQLAGLSTVDLVLEAQRGDERAREELLVRSLPDVQRWARGRVPSSARSYMDTCDLVQEAALHTFRRLEHFTPQHAGSMPAYLRRAAGNRVLDELRRRARHGTPDQLDEAMRSNEDDPLTETMFAEERARYLRTLRGLRVRDRRLIIARHGLDWSFAVIARRLGLPSAAAARMALRRAERTLRDQLACRSIRSATGARFCSDGRKNCRIARGSTASPRSTSEM
jgi:RNA polymerase sigma-70 factor, ECF subfamily